MAFDEHIKYAWLSRSWVWLSNARAKHPILIVPGQRSLPHASFDNFNNDALASN